MRSVIVWSPRNGVGRITVCPFLRLCQPLPETFFPLPPGGSPPSSSERRAPDCIASRIVYGFVVYGGMSGGSGAMRLRTRIGRRGRVRGLSRTQKGASEICANNESYVFQESARRAGSIALAECGASREHEALIPPGRGDILAEHVPVGSDAGDHLRRAGHRLASASLHLLRSVPGQASCKAFGRETRALGVWGGRVLQDGADLAKPRSWAPAALAILTDADRALTATQRQARLDEAVGTAAA